MTIPYDEGLGIHPQDDYFLDREVWDLSQTPDELRPLMLHYHPLVIYRFQVLKQADVVLALFLQGDRFTHEEKRADFEYYDPITTGDSTLSAVVQSVIAAEVGYHEAALDYFHQALYVDLHDLHGNTVDGLHVASAGGVWSTLVHGFGGHARLRRRAHLRPAAAGDLAVAAVPALLARHPAAGRADPGRARALGRRRATSDDAGDGARRGVRRAAGRPGGGRAARTRATGSTACSASGRSSAACAPTAARSRPGVPEPIQPPEEMEHGAASYRC